MQSCTQLHVKDLGTRRHATERQVGSQEVAVERREPRVQTAGYLVGSVPASVGSGTAQGVNHT